MTAMRRVLVVAAAAVLLSAGCGEEQAAAPLRYYISSPQEVMAVRRIVFIALEHNEHYPRIAGNMTESLYQSLQRKDLFHVELVQRTDPVCEGLPISLDGGFTMNELAEIRQRLKCDAVLFGKITHFQQYPVMKIGLYLQLVDLRKGKAIWSIDHTWDSTNKDAEASLKRYFQKELRGAYAPVNWEMAIMSPLLYQKYVAWEATETLPDPHGAKP